MTIQVPHTVDLSGLSRGAASRRIAVLQAETDILDRSSQERATTEAFRQRAAERRAEIEVLSEHIADLCLNLSRSRNHIRQGRTDG